MATQGLVTLLQDRKVIAKVVAGCGGYNAADLAVAVAASWEPHWGTIELQSEAGGAGFGCPSCRVIVCSDGDYEAEDELNPRYWDTLQDPTFNPRWDRGDGAQTFLVDLDTRMVQEAVSGPSAAVEQDDSATTESALTPAKNPPASTVEDPPDAPSQQGREAT